MNSDGSGELVFRNSERLTLGVELELQLVHPETRDLCPASRLLLAIAGTREFPGNIKPEITQSMIEVNTGIHGSWNGLAAELAAIRDNLVAIAAEAGVGVSGGGAHPFHHWRDRKIYPQARYAQLWKTYRYLMQQFTVFGQHVHVGCADGDSAILLLHGLNRFIPHFIALSACSPFYQSVDTGFAACRPNIVNAFPLSGCCPPVQTWDEFVAYFSDMRGMGIVESMKDFYWDIRPKPEFGTVEIRVCDTPLTVAEAAEFAAYAQMLARRILDEDRMPPLQPLYRTYAYNRFLACRYGLHAELVDPEMRTRRTLAEDILATLDTLVPHAQALGSSDVLASLRARAEQKINGTLWLRKTFKIDRSFPSLVARQVMRWRESV